MAKKKPAKNPKPDAIRKARLTAGLTQQQSAKRIGYSRRSWQEWESGGRKMRALAFEAFKQTLKSEN